MAFTYDNANRRSTLTLPNGITAEHAYDRASQITGITYKLGATVVGDLTYGYDEAGRRRQMGGSLARTGLPQALSSAAYDAANELTRWGSTNLAYDGNGNLVSDGVNTYTWNVRNQLTSISGGTTASFQYDASGRRIARGATTFFYDGVNPIQELSAGAATANLLTGLGVDEFFTRTDSSGAAHLLSDALGSTLALTDSTGALQTQYTYEPFGNTTSTGPTSSNPFQYTGRENDGTGLYYYRARYYNPATERFITEDPLGFVSGLNLYSYVGGSPMSFVDPLGLDKNPANNDAPQEQTKQQCIDDFLKNGYGPIGNFMANTGVPSFSAISIFTNTRSWLKGEGLALAIKGIASGGPVTYGKILTTTGNNLMAYPGMAGAGADALETGAFWTTTGATVGQAVLYVGGAALLVATTADAYARWTCRNVP